MNDPAYLIEKISDHPSGWSNFRFITGWGMEGRKTRLGWNGSRFARDSGLAIAAKRAPRELESLTEWLEAGSP